MESKNESSGNTGVTDFKNEHLGGKASQVCACF